MNKNNQRQFLDKLAKKLNIKNPLDWKHVKDNIIKELGGIVAANIAYRMKVRDF